MSDYIITNGELMHYGVPGMKWGVRKSRAERERDYVKKWRKRELAKIEKRATKQLNSGNRAIERRANKYEDVKKREGDNSDKTKDAAARYIVKNADVKYDSKVSKAEASKVMKMSYKDIKDEQARVGKEVITATLATVASVSASALVGAPISTVYTVNARAIKTNSRVTAEERRKAKLEAYVEAGEEFYKIR